MKTNATQERVDNRPVSHPERAARLRMVRKTLPSAVNAFTQAYEGKSRVAAIKAFCLECIGFNRDEIRKCSAPWCPLWAMRPYQKRRGK